MHIIPAASLSISAFSTLKGGLFELRTADIIPLFINHQFLFVLSDTQIITAARNGPRQQGPCKTHNVRYAVPSLSGMWPHSYLGVGRVQLVLEISRLVETGDTIVNARDNLLRPLLDIVGFDSHMRCAYTQSSGLRGNGHQVTKPHSGTPDSHTSVSLKVNTPKSSSLYKMCRC